jgi:hypothetical protein
MQNRRARSNDKTMVASPGAAVEHWPIAVAFRARRIGAGGLAAQKLLTESLD